MDGWRGHLTLHGFGSARSEFVPLSVCLSGLIDLERVGFVDERQSD